MKTYNTLNEALNHSSLVANVIEQLLDRSDDNIIKLSAVEDEILNFMLNDNISLKKFTPKNSKLVKNIMKNCLQ